MRNSFVRIAFCDGQSLLKMLSGARKCNFLTYNGTDVPILLVWYYDYLYEYIIKHNLILYNLILYGMYTATVCVLRINTRLLRRFISYRRAPIYIEYKNDCNRPAGAVADPPRYAKTRKAVKSISGAATQGLCRPSLCLHRGAILIRRSSPYACRARSFITTNDLMWLNDDAFCTKILYIYTALLWWLAAPDIKFYFITCTCVGEQMGYMRVRVCCGFGWQSARIKCWLCVTRCLGRVVRMFSVFLYRMQRYVF